jgi:hypothetical protein
MTPTLHPRRLPPLDPQLVDDLRDLAADTARGVVWLGITAVLLWSMFSLSFGWAAGLR